ncbi:Methylenetetrahydrofolate--tRNA-(uracil-5-)-methyltransferase TrmFO [bioreactor metagenome]|uniref:Methylenetetrahydrofolate--tRNA-(Uracil-5-)-methyltransferase TrmFO n=1 Tax=bioreactor metagenome TaxID=1076179 RepID=A0A645FQR9_9ZZZZ
MESAGSGLVAGISLARELLGKEPVDFTAQTALGAMAHYVSEYNGRDFQPMNINFGILADLPDAPRNKTVRYAAIAERALHVIDGIIANKL